MLKIINNYNNLFIADFSRNNEKIIKVIFSENPNFCIDGQIINPFVKDVKTNDNILVSNQQHIKKLSHYVNCFGLPKRKILAIEKEKQTLVVEEVKILKKLRKI